MQRFPEYIWFSVKLQSCIPHYVSGGGKGGGQGGAGPDVHSLTAIETSSVKKKKSKSGLGCGMCKLKKIQKSVSRSWWEVLEDECSNGAITRRAPSAVPPGVRCQTWWPLR